MLYKLIDLLCISIDALVVDGQELVGWFGEGFNILCVCVCPLNNVTIIISVALLLI